MKRFQRALSRLRGNLILKGAKTKKKTITIAWQEDFAGPGMTLRCVWNHQSSCQSVFKSPNISVLRPSASARVEGRFTGGLSRPGVGSHFHSNGCLVFCNFEASQAEILLSRQLQNQQVFPSCSPLNPSGNQFLIF